MAKNVAQKGNPRQFVAILVIVALAGIGTLGYVLTRPSAKAITVDPRIPAGPAEGHLLGKADAPVQVIEFGDFECPACGDFANVTEPDIRSRLIAPGIVALRFFDFPLTQHKNTWAAHNAAACADDQGKFWEMHDHLYAHQDEWNGEATSNPMKFFRRYAKEIGIDVPSWESCVMAQTHAGRIKGNQDEGTRRQIGGTPAFIIGDKMVGGVSYDEFKRLVDAALAAKSSAPKSGTADPAAKKGASTGDAPDGHRDARAGGRLSRDLSHAVQARIYRDARLWNRRVRARADEPVGDLPRTTRRALGRRLLRRDAGHEWRRFVR